MMTTVVLGAGGTVGLAYHAGVLKALHEIAGIEAADADLLIGTSAGSAASAYLRSGYTSDDLWRMALGTHETLVGLTDGEIEERRRALFTRNWASPVELMRLGIGTSYALLRMAGLPPALPYDLVRRERVVLGNGADTTLNVPRAVLASCAIPGMYRPVRDGRRVLVDGGVSSTTNLDLVAPRPPGLVIVVAPMAYETGEAQRPADQLTRRHAAKALARETRRAREAGNALVVIRPCRREVRAHGRNFMRLDTSEAIARLAYECAARALQERLTATAA